jgi:hypothetical protein
MENIREMRSYLDTTRAENIANFSSALITAFEILHKVSSLHNNNFYLPSHYVFTKLTLCRERKSITAYAK